MSHSAPPNSNNTNLITLLHHLTTLQSQSNQLTSTFTQSFNRFDGMASIAREMLQDDTVVGSLIVESQIQSEVLAITMRCLEHYHTVRETSPFIERTRCDEDTILRILQALLRVNISLEFFHSHEHYSSASKCINELASLRRKGMKRVDTALARLMGTVRNGMLMLLEAHSEVGDLIDQNATDTHPSTPTPDTSPQSDLTGTTVDAVNQQSVQVPPPSTNHTQTSQHPTNPTHMPPPSTDIPSPPQVTWQTIPTSPILRTKVLTQSVPKSLSNILQEAFQILSIHFHNHSRYRKIYREERKRCIHEWLLMSHPIYKNAIPSSKHTFEKNRLKGVIGKLSKKERRAKLLTMGKKKFDQLRERYEQHVRKSEENSRLDSNASELSVGSSTMSGSVGAAAGLSVEVPNPQLLFQHFHNGTPIGSPLVASTTIWENLADNSDTVSPTHQDAAASLVTTHNIQSVISFIHDLCDIFLSEYALVRQLFLRRDHDRIMVKMMHEICTIMEYIIETILHDNEETSLSDKLGLASVLQEKRANATLRQLFALCDADLEVIFFRCKMTVAHKLNQYQLMNEDDRLENPILSRHLEREQEQRSGSRRGWVARLLRASHAGKEGSPAQIHPACAYVELYFRVLDDYAQVVPAILAETEHLGAGRMVPHALSALDEEQILKRHKQLVIASILHTGDALSARMQPVQKWIYRLNTLRHLMKRVVPHEEMEHYERMLQQDLRDFVDEVWRDFLYMVEEYMPTAMGGWRRSWEVPDEDNYSMSRYAFSSFPASHGTSTRQSIMSMNAQSRPLTLKVMQRIHDKAVELYNAQRRVLVYDARLLWNIRQAMKNTVVDTFRRFYEAHEYEWSRESRMRGLTPDTLEQWIENMYQVA